MGNQQKKGPKGAHTGAPLTHRRQKQQRRAPKQQRQAQTMPPTRQVLRHQPQMSRAPLPEETAQPAVRLEAGAIAVAPPSSDENITPLIVDSEDRDAVAAEPAGSKKRAAAQPARDETTPPRSHTPRGTARRKADSSAHSLEIEEQSATKPATPAVRKRPTKQVDKQTTKYPTLARMAAIAPAASIPSASAPAHPASPLNTAPLPAMDHPAVKSSAAHMRGADVEQAETMNLPPQAASRTEHLDDTQARRAIARDDTVGTGEPHAIIEPRKPVTTRRLAEAIHSAVHASGDATERRLEDAAARAIAGAREARRQASQASKTNGMKRPQALPEIDLVLPVAAGHIVVAFVAALTGTILLLVGQEGALWPLALSVVLGVGAWLAYIVSQRDRARSLAGGVLLISQLGALCWMFALLGARASLLALAPAMLLLALRTAGRLAMLLGTGATFALYIAAVLIAPALPISRPDFLTTELAVIDGVVVFVGLFTLLVLALDVQNGRIRALARARASRHEARLLRERAALLRQQLEEDAALLDEALGEALHGHGIDPAALEQVDTMLSPLVERVIAVADRLETLQRDREDRVRLEGAVRQVTRALERGWLGLPWSWPDPSDTLLDELVALLRAPNPRQMPLGREEASPALMPIPSLDSSLMPRSWDAVDTPVINPYARSDVRAGLPPITNRPSYPDRSDHYAIGGRSISGAAWPAHTRNDDFAGQPAYDPHPSRVGANPLPWDEWDTWGTWDAAGRND
ncbi:MAG: hypothetical protein ACXVCX_06600 [Ktedonobacterales bacterium]